MAPNLETFKNISNRITRFRQHHRNQDMADNNNNKKSSQQSSQASTPASTTTSLSANQTQSKKGPGASLYTPSTMPSKQGPVLSKSAKSSKLPPISGNKTAPPNATSSLYPGPFNAFPAKKAATGESSHRSASMGNDLDGNDQIGTLGSQSNPIDLTDSSTPDQPYSPFQFPDYPEHPVGPFGSTAPISAMPSWYSPFLANPLLPPPHSSTQNNAPQGSPWNFFPEEIDTPPLSDFLPPPELWNSPMMEHWFTSASPLGSYLQPEQVNSQGASTAKMPAQNMGASWGWPGNNAAFPTPQVDLTKEPEADKMAVDAESPGDSSESSVDPEQLPEDTAAIDSALRELKPVQEFVTECIGRTCSRCNKTKSKSMESNDVVKMTAGWTKPGGKIMLGVSCQNVFCAASTCLGCGKIMSPVTVNGPSIELDISGTKLAVGWCCDAGRLAAIWALACGWEAPSWKSRTMTRVVSKVRERTNAKSTAVQSALAMVAMSCPQATAKGVGYGSGRLDYLPFHSIPYLNPRSHARPTPKKPIDTQEYLLHEAYFKLLAILLPSYTRTRTTALDVTPPFFLAHMLSRSPLIEKAATMLSNDSIGEISRQYQVHDAVLDFFDTLGSHPITAELVYNDRNLYHPKGGSLLEVSIGPVKNKGRIVTKDTGKSLLALLGKLAAQSQTVLRHARSNPADFQNSEGADLLKLSRRLSRVSTLHAANMQRFRTTMEISEDKPEINFTEWHRENCVSDVADETIMRDFMCAQAAKRALKDVPVRGRMKRLITELSTLQTSLPEGIFIRYGSSRLDVMKVLIIGPKYTPYEHGLFEFDLWCPLDYPNSPPQMKFKTTNSGKIRFNPNLYEDGKICLSLLGTWSGEPWRASQSTILQVLVSIQSMILCEQPWYNEPGREEAENKVQSTRYNNEVRTWTMKYAIMPWINAVGTKGANQEGDAAAEATSIWQETARLYLEANAKEVLLSTKQAASKSKKPALQTIALLIGSTLQAKGYLV
ncbi:hypothetical protein F4781DRAFT_158799 [Annulohypoxylon bovei var. microspora]|nr:hypothetical protein F4781DRAFT_158799 [Annulohypoxylon bovei var. microspora]